MGGFSVKSCLVVQIFAGVLAGSTCLAGIVDNLVLLSSTETKNCLGISYLPERTPVSCCTKRREGESDPNDTNRALYPGLRSRFLVARRPETGAPRRSAPTAPRDVLTSIYPRMCWELSPEPRLLSWGHKRIVSKFGKVLPDKTVLTRLGIHSRGFLVLERYTSRLGCYHPTITF